MCANTPAGRTGNRRHDARTTSASLMDGTGMTMTRTKRVLPGNEKDRCANTGLSQEELERLAAVGAEEELRKLEERKRVLEALIRKHGLRGKAKFGEPTNESQRRTRDIYTDSVIERSATAAR